MERSFGTRPAEKILGRTLSKFIIFTALLTPLFNDRVRSREGRRNRAPPPRVRYNKDGKKVNPNQAAAKTSQA